MVVQLRVLDGLTRVTRLLFQSTSPDVVTPNADQWVVTGPSTQSIADVEAAQTLSFAWTEQFYITVTSTNGSPTQSSQWVNAGNAFTVSVTSPDVVTPNADQWVVTGPSTQSIADVEVAQTLSFALTEQFYITVTSTHGSPTQSSQWVNAGNAFTVSVTSPDVVTPNADQWVVTGPSTQSIADVEAAETLSFAWTEQFYITVTSTHGSPTQSSQWVNAGNAFTVSVTSPDVVTPNADQWNL